MSDDTESGFGWKEMDEDMPGLDTEEERDQWANILMGVDLDVERALAVLVKDEHGNMVVRFRYQDGSEEIYDVAIRRSVEVVAPTEERESN